MNINSKKRKLNEIDPEIDNIKASVDQQIGIKRRKINDSEININWCNNVASKASQEINKSEWVSATSLGSYMMNDGIIDLLKQKKINYLNAVSDNGSDGSGGGGNDKQYVAKFAEGLKFEEDVMKLINKKFKVETVCNERGDCYKMDKYNETKKIIENLNVEIIYQGLLYNFKTKTFGMPDLIVRSDIVNKLVKEKVFLDSELKRYSHSRRKECLFYCIVDIKSSQLKLCSENTYVLNSGYFPANKAQMYVYIKALNKIQDNGTMQAYLLGKVSKYTTKGVTYVNTDCFGKLGTIDFKSRDKPLISKIRNAVRWQKHIKKNWDKYDLMNPQSYEFYPNMCNHYDDGYHLAKSNIANHLNEITQVWYCGYNERVSAYRCGVKSWKDDQCNTRTMGITGKYRPSRIDAILNVNRQNRKLFKYLNPQNLNGWLQKDKLELLVDFETATYQEQKVVNGSLITQSKLTLPMIGVGWYDEDDTWKYKNFTVNRFGHHSEEYIIDRFYKLVKELMTKFKVTEFPKMYHWGHAERSIFKRMNKDHGGKWRTKIPDSKWIDFCKIMQDETIVVKGALNFSVKTIAKAMHKNGMIKTTWADDGMDGYTAMLKLIECNKLANREGKNLIDYQFIRDVINYNEVDCKTVGEIIGYLRANISDVSEVVIEK